MLKRNLIAAGAAFTLLSATSANALVTYDVEAIQNMNFTGPTFSQNLAREYKDFATFEAYQMYDWIDAEHFAEKSVLAAGGQDVRPEQVENWNIPEEHVAELKSARTLLDSAFANDARTIAPREAARAQVKYDCWMEQQEENHQPSHIAACKSRFFAALDALNAKMKPKPVAKMTTETVEVPVSRIAAIFFDFDRAAITPGAATKLKVLAEKLNERTDVELSVVGHADTSGPAGYNRALSRERAQAVIDDLRQRGLKVRDLKDLDVMARGETDPAVKTGDGVREQANRRVEIYAYGKLPIGVTVLK